MSSSGGQGPAGPLDHFVSEAPFDPEMAETVTPEQERYYLASQWLLMWWKFKRHRLAVISGVVLVVMYGSIFMSEILAPYNLHSRHSAFIFAPPQEVHLFHEGRFIGPFIHGTTVRLDLETLKREHRENPEKIQRLRFFCLGDGYRFWGQIEGRFHLVCPAEGGTWYKVGLTGYIYHELLKPGP